MWCRYKRLEGKGRLRPRVTSYWSAALVELIAFMLVDTKQFSPQRE